MLWQIDASKKMVNVLNKVLLIDDVVIGGSVESPTELDIYSDVDIKIILLDNVRINIKNVLDAIETEFAPVFGFEVISHSRKDAIRVCLENGMRFDLIIRYPNDKEPMSEDDTFSQKVDSVVNQFWFFASMILIKLGRRDNLIAAHLSLELYQLVIIIQMLVRDHAKDTNIHRFGDSENIPFLHTQNCISASYSLNCNTADKILSMLFSVANEMENELARLNLSSSKKNDTLKSMALQLLT